MGTTTEKTASSATVSSASSQAPVVTTKTNAVVNPPASVANTDMPNIDVEDSTRMPLEDAQKIFLPIIIVFTVIAIALAIGYFIKAGKTALAQKYMIIFIAVALVIFLIAMLVFYGVYGQL